MHQQRGNLPVLHWMRAKARLLGHPIHPMLIVFPLGLFTVAAIFDVIYISTHNGHWADLSYWMIASGIMGGLIAGVFGLIRLARYSARHAREIYRSPPRPLKRCCTAFVHR
jgi:uncharacterized membrane protein